MFVPNLICWSTQEDDQIHHADTIEEFLHALEDLTEVEGDERPRKVISFFHNMRGFDGNFVLEALYDQGRAVEKPLMQGAKILYFESGNLIFKDSMNFFAMALEKFPPTFNLRERHKGFFLAPSTVKKILSILASTPQKKITIQTKWIVRRETSFWRGTPAKSPNKQCSTFKGAIEVLRKRCQAIKKRVLEVCG